LNAKGGPRKAIMIGVTLKIKDINSVADEICNEIKCKKNNN